MFSFFLNIYIYGGRGLKGFLNIVMFCASDFLYVLPIKHMSVRGYHLTLLLHRITKKEVLWCHDWKGFTLKYVSWLTWLLRVRPFYWFSLAVIVEEGGLQPDDVIHLNDNSTSTCSNFVTNRQQYTQIFKDSFCADDQMSVTLVGRQMACDNGLYVVGLSPPDVGKPQNIWKRCQQTRHITTDSDTEWCSYDCHCSGRCVQTMVLKWPQTMTDTSWTLCDIIQHCGGRI